MINRICGTSRKATNQTVMGQDKPFGATQLAMLALPTDQEEHLDCLLLPHLNYIHFCSDNH